MGCGYRVQLPFANGLNSVTVESLPLVLSYLSALRRVIGDKFESQNVTRKMSKGPDPMSSEKFAG